MLSDLQKEELYRTYYSKVFGYLRSRLNDTPTAEDLASDVFVKVYGKIDTFDETKSSPSTWIYTITRNTLTDFFRTRKTFCELPESEEDGESVEDDLCREESLETLAKALESLDERERDILILRYYSGDTLKDIAAKMGISYAYVKVLQNKALGKVRNFLENISHF